MKLIKSLALGSAAALVAFSGAKAADLPGAEPVEYVKVCDAYGAGFFYIPGSDTCLNIGGFVRLDVSAGEVSRRSDGANQGSSPSNNIGYRSRARVWFDARTDTEYGTVRAYIRAQFQRQSGAVNVGGSRNQGQLALTDVGGDDSIFDKAFVQFAGLTAGLTDSFWDFKPYPTFANPFVSDRTLSVLAYTADFGGGFSASIAVEDGTARRSSVNGFNVNSGAIGGAAGIHGEMKYPDIVGNVRIQQGWGEVQLSGMAHNNTSSFRQVGDEWGYGAMIGAKINLPALAKGDFLWGSAGYSKGALSYLGVGGGGDFTFAIANTQNIVNGNRIVDFEISGSKIRQTEAYAFNLGFLHYWDPKWRSALQGTYINADVKSGHNDFAAGAVTANLIWTPVKKLDIGGEVSYVKVTDRSSGAGGYNLKSDDSWVGRLRVQRDF